MMRRFAIRLTTAACFFSAVAVFAGARPQARTGGPSFEAATLEPWDRFEFLTSAAGRSVHREWKSPDVPGVCLECADSSMVHMVVGGPSWMTTDMYRVEAKASVRWLAVLSAAAQDRGDVSLNPCGSVQVARSSEISRGEATYHLVRARPDGRLGAHLRPITSKCAAWLVANAPQVVTPPGDATCGRSSLMGGAVGAPGGNGPLTMDGLAEDAVEDVFGSNRRGPHGSERHVGGGICDGDERPTRRMVLTCPSSLRSRSNSGSSWSRRETWSMYL